MEFEYGMLRERIQQRFATQEDFARALGITEASLSRKLQNEGDFTRKQMIRASRLLSIDALSIPEYFFVEKVQKDELFVERQQRGSKLHTRYVH